MWDVVDERKKPFLFSIFFRIKILLLINYPTAIVTLIKKI